MTQTASQLQVDDEAFLVESLIERCPRTAMLRELVMNALESASATAGGAGKVWIGATRIGTTNKLTIRNSGPGMDQNALRRMTDLSSSIGKTKGLGGNFGIGAKVATLPANQLGVRYRSCANGKVHEVVIGKFDGVYARLVRRSFQGELQEILDVSDEHDKAARAADWTEVVLLGNSMEQDTAVDPFGGDPVMPAFWIPQSLYHRFFDIPDNVEITLEPGIHWEQTPRLFEPFARRRATAFAKCERVATADGIAVHYYYDPPHPGRPWENASAERALQTSESVLAILFRGELYDLRCGSEWSHTAPRYGVSFAGRHVSVFIELPRDYNAQPDIYRQFLRYGSGEQEQIACEQFASVVRDNIPDWLRDIFDRLADEATPDRGLIDELKDFRRSLGVHLYEHVEDLSALSQEARERWVEPELEIIQLFDTTDINDRWLDGRAACFYPDTRQLYVNARYDSINQLAESLAGYALRQGLDAAAGDSLNAICAAVAREQIIRRLARSVFYAVAKAADPERWHAGHLQKASSPEALSIVADEWRDLESAAQRALRLRLTKEGAHESRPPAMRETAQASAPKPAEPAPAPQAAEATPAPEGAPAPGENAPEAPAVKRGFRIRKLG